MSRAFFLDMGEALRGFLPAKHAGFHHNASARNLKVWFASWHEHYEIQLVSPAVLRAGGLKAQTEALEIGFHAEHPRPDHNDAALALLEAREKTWRRAVGRDAVAGGFIGRKEIRDRWRRVSELWEDAEVTEEGTAIEAADKLATYIKAFEPILARTPEGRCACWSATSVSIR